MTFCSSFCNCLKNVCYTRSDSEEATAPITVLPRELMQNIFSFLHPQELCVARRTSHQFQQIWSSNIWLEYDLQQIFPNLFFINRAHWEMCLNLDELDLSFEDLEEWDPSKKRLISTSKEEKLREIETYRKFIIELIQMFKEVQIERVREENPGLGPVQEFDPGITVLTMPKGTSFAKLMLALHPPEEDLPEEEQPIDVLNTNESERKRIRRLLPPISLTNRDEIERVSAYLSTVKQSYQVAITNGVLKNSRNFGGNVTLRGEGHLHYTNFSPHYNKNKRLVSQQNCTVPEMNEYLALILFSFLLSSLSPIPVNSNPLNSQPRLDSSPPRQLFPQMPRGTWGQTAKCRMGRPYLIGNFSLRNGIQFGNIPEMQRMMIPNHREGEVGIAGCRRLS